MATIYNSDLSKEIIDGGKIQISRENIPNQIAEKVVPVMEVNPKLLRASRVLAHVNATTTANQLALLAAQANKDVYITGLQVSNTQDAACDNIIATVRGVFNGAQLIFWSKIKPTTTATTYNDYLSFPTPLKIDKNTSIDYNLQFTAGTSNVRITLIGYTVENPNA